MTRRPEKTAAATRRARQGGGGFLGMEEMAKLAQSHGDDPAQLEAFRAKLQRLQPKREEKP